MIHLRLFGAPEVTANGVGLHSVLAQPKRFALLAYLVATEPRGYHRRDSLLALFWPERPADAARAALSRAVYHLRQMIGDEFIISRTVEELGINHERLTCDLAAFEQRLAVGEFSEALALYRGELLAGFHIDDAPEFMQWLDVVRTKQRASAAAAALKLVEAANAKGDLDGATFWATRAIELAPYAEHAVRLLVDALVGQGKRADALLAYDSYARRLVADLAATPSAELRALESRLRSGEEIATTPRVSTVSRVAAAPLVTTSDPVAFAAARTHSIGDVLPHSWMRRRWGVVAASSMIALLAALALTSKGTVSRERVPTAANFALDLPDSSAIPTRAWAPIALDPAGQQVAVVVTATFSWSLWATWFMAATALVAMFGETARQISVRG